MANSQLDAYIETIESRLNGLPPARRQEEMQEIRQHLEALAAGHRIAGLGEVEAVKAAIRQFGHAEQVGQELSKASQQQRMRYLWLILIYIITVAVSFGIYAINDNPDTLFAKLVMAFSLPASILALGVAEIVQTYLRSRNKQNRA
jgi:uncharacterized membrane protein